MNRERFRFFPSVHHESDMLIGVPHYSFSEEMRRSAFEEQARLREMLLNHIQLNPSFATSLEPLDCMEPGTDLNSSPGLPEEITTMLRCARITGTGPMSSVAGLFAEMVGVKIAGQFGLDEIIVENGGDLYVKNSSDLVSAIHAGGSPLSGKMAFVTTPGSWGICTSSGTVGHSYSKGMADAVTVISENAPLADAWATSLANMAQSPDDIEPLLDKVCGIREILGFAVIMDQRMGIRGQFQVKPLS